MERNSLRNWWTCDPCGVAWRGDALSECPTCNKHGVKGISMCNRCGEHAPDGGLCSDCTIAASEPRTIPFAPNESKPLKCDWVPWAQKMADKLVEDEAERYTAQTLDAQDWYTRKEPNRVRLSAHGSARWRTRRARSSICFELGTSQASPAIKTYGKPPTFYCMLQSIGSSSMDWWTNDDETVYVLACIAAAWLFILARFGCGL